MDILHLVDRLEELFNESRTVPFTRNVVVDEDKMLDLIDQMRVTIPEEVKKAQQLAAQKDRILAQAQEEANRIVQLAREKAEQIVDREATVKSAQNRADQILAQARADAQATRQDADDYVMDSLRHLEVEVSRLQTQVRNGLRKLEEDQLRVPQPLPQVRNQTNDHADAEGEDDDAPQVKEME
ncbi:MAG: ATP synthase F0 subunit B [Anaerolineae bacterium]|jgi:vacuolar-type H+-ATPase subunit H|nr:ATP synthase F0 subunit B [Anaerolineae bacterium]